MVTSESRDERLARYERRLAERPARDINSAEELSRSEAARASRHFGFAPPEFRTSVKVRFSGDGVKGHDLLGSVAGTLIGGVSDVVDAAAKTVKMPKGLADLYLSPVVTAGSTIIELLGPAPAPPAQEKLDSEIDDGPIDSILSYIFALLDRVNREPLEGLAQSDLEISRRLGKKLFSLSKDLIDSQVDINLIWTRPRGTSRSADFTRNTARGFRTLLDMEKVELVPYTEDGTLNTISTDGKIRFSYVKDTKEHTISLDSEDVDEELLRDLWAGQVRLSWEEKTTSHPRRAWTKVVRTVTGVERLS